nr:acyl-CoA dehydrogenase [Pleionea sp. CnH1-48]
MTEAEAGSDVGALRTKAIKQDNGSYRIEGEKIFISAGMHDLADNIAYIVLARPEGAPSGTAGLSCFVVPRFRLNEKGEPAESNGVHCVRLEEKMGLHGCATAHLEFGLQEPCYGYLLGDRENIGLFQLLNMMNLARIATGIYALGMASSAYLNAAEYASGRVQGADFRQAFNPRAAKVPIIQHVDVKRMLLEMKSKVEGCRALIVKLSFHQSMAMNIEFENAHDKDKKAPWREEHFKHQGIVNLLTPIVKAYTSDQAWRIAELAMQVYGGHGYIADHPLEQYARDIKILSIWEGTNFMQSADLMRDKLAMGRDSKLLKLFHNEVSAFLDEHRGNNVLHSELLTLERAVGTLVEAHALMGQWVKERKLEMIFGVSTRFLEMMAEVTISWLLLDGALIAQSAITASDVNDDEKAFYEGRILSAQFYIHNILPNVFSKYEIIKREDVSALESNSDTFMTRSQQYA